MADFEYEQLKTLFENLGDRLDRTPGDQATADELNKMRSLLDRMNKQMNTKRKGPSRQDHKEFIDQFFEQWKSENPLGTLKNSLANQRKGTLIADEKKRAKSFKPFGDDPGGVNKAAKGFGSAITGMNNKLNKASGGLDNFMSNLKKGGILAAVGGGSGTALGKVGSALGERTDAYRDLITSSEGSITSIEEMTNAANAAGLSARELADALLKGTNGARQLGALKFASLTNALTKTTAAAGNLGMTFEKRQELQQDYLQMQSDQGTLNTLNQEQMTRGMIRLVKSSEETAHVLGLTREDALKAARERAADHTMNQILSSMKIDRDSYNAAMTAVGNVSGDVGEKMLKQLLANGSLTTEDTTTAAATNSELFKTTQQIADMLKTGQQVSPTSIGQMLKSYSDNVRNDPATAALARLSESGRLDPTVSSALDTRAQGADIGQNLKTDGLSDRLGDAGTRALLDGEEVQRRASSALAAAFDALSNTTLKKFGGSMENLALKMEDWSTRIAQTAQNSQSHPTAMSTLAIGALGVAAALPIVGTIMKGRSLLKGGGNLLKMVRGGGGAAGAAEGGTLIGGEAAAAGGAEVGGAALGGGELAAGGLGLAGTAGLALGGVGLAGLGMYGGNRLINNRKGESFLGNKDKEKGLVGSRGSGYLASILAGAGGGALVGSAFAGVGAVPGALIGGLGGLGSAVWSDWDNLWGNNSPAGNGSTTPTTAMMPPPRRQTQAPADASKQASGVPADQMMNRIMEANEASVVFLKKIKENSEAQVNMMKDELNMMRGYNDKIVRLLEENNTYTKMSALNGH